MVKKTLWSAAAAAALAWHSSAFACAACYGQSDSPMALGMNWGIMVLLGVIGVVLSGITAFFVFVAAKSPRPPMDSESEASSQPKGKV